GDVQEVEANESRLGQLVLNLFVNAAQAIPEGRADHNEIRIVTSRSEGPPPRVVLEVRDTGSGMPPEIISRIFDPFFTTKPATLGTGLGLAICHRIVRDLGGEIHVESELGKGSVFRVMLPIAKRLAAPTVPVQAPVVAKQRGRILIVDDEEILGTAV